MFDIYIKFIVFSIGIENNNISTYVLSSNQENLELPSIKLNTEHSIDLVKKLCFENYVDLKLEWIEHKLIDILKEETNINIYYTCRIPIESKLVNGLFIPINKALFDKTVQKASRYI